tara:strand:- start:85 stop:585 length:501 start_codon:yes stop_codon:yes gene_type:complete
MKEKIFYLENLKKEIKDIREELIKDCFKYRDHSLSKGNNHELFTKHHDKLYSLFLKSCQKNLKKFNIIKTKTKLFSYLTDKDYEGEVFWHNHQDTCTVCGVLYLKTVKGCGIKLRHNDRVAYVEPKTYDLLVFPGFIDHLPVIHKTKERISIQLEISCFESHDQIW